MNGMIEFIKTQGTERVKEIEFQAESDFTSQSEK